MICDWSKFNFRSQEEGLLPGLSVNYPSKVLLVIVKLKRNGPAPRHRVHLRVTEPSRQTISNEGGREGSEGTRAGLGSEWREMQCCIQGNAGKGESLVPAFTRGSVLRSVTVNNAKMGTGNWEWEWERETGNWKWNIGDGTLERDASAQVSQRAQSRQ
jgi:hypothetical protein